MQREHSPQGWKRILLAPLFGQILKNAFIGLERLLGVRFLQQVAEAQLLIPGRSNEPRQLFIGEARPRGIARLDLSLKQVAQELYSLRNVLQGKAQIGGHLAYRVIARFGRQNLQVVLKRLGGLAFLEQLFGALHAFRDFGPVHSLDCVCHES